MFTEKKKMKIYPRAICIQKFRPAHKSQLSFNRDDVVKVLSFRSEGEGWWEVKHKDSVGFAPSNHFVVIGERLFFFSNILASIK